MASTQTRLIAVVVTFNRLAQLKITLERLLAEPCDRIVVVNNCSNDGTGEWLATATDDRLDVLSLPENVGGAGGFEAGTRFAVKQHDPDWIVVMDDDARPLKGALADFLAADHKGQDGVAAAVYYPDGRICEMNRPSVNPFWHLSAFARTLAGGGRMGFHIPDQAYKDNTRAIDVASFVGLFLSRSAFQRIGYPDGKLFLYGDDVIYTLGLRKAGGKIAFEPDVCFEHDCSTFESDARVYRPLWKAYYNYRNGLIMYRLAAGLLFWPVLLVILPKWALNGRRYGSDRGTYFRLLFRAVGDGLFKRKRLSLDQVIKLASSPVKE